MYLLKISKYFICVLATGVLFAASVPELSIAQQGKQPELKAKRAGDLLIRKRLEKLVSRALPELEVVSIERSPIQGFYLIQMTQQVNILITERADYMMIGDLYQVASNSIVNLSDKQRNGWRLAQVKAVKKKDQIIFSPASGSKRFIYVFTDVDCGYCRKLHQSISAYNARGIEVRYLAFPRAGIGSPTYRKMVSTWCSQDSKQSLTILKNGGSIPERICVDNPVAEQFELGQALGVQGTPAIITDRGALIPGFVAPAELAKRMGVK